MHLGYFGIILLMVVSPLPPEVFMPMAGFMAAQGELNVVAVVVSGVIGFLLSVLPWYLAGRYLGAEGLKQVLYRHRRWLVLSTDRLEKATEWFYRRSRQAVLLSLLLPGVRNIISIPAGISGMPLSSYLLYSSLGATVWLGALTTAGYFLGSRYGIAQKYVGSAYNVILAILIAAIMIWGVQRYLKRRGKN